MIIQFLGGEVELKRHETLAEGGKQTLVGVGLIAAGITAPKLTK